MDDPFDFWEEVHVLSGCAINNLKEIRRGPRTGPAEKYGNAVRLDTIATPQPPVLVSTGIPEFDAAIGGGIAHRRLTLFVADTGFGKTRFPLSWYISAARAGYTIVIMSTELTQEDVRLILEEAGSQDVLSRFFVLYGQNPDEFITALDEAVGDSTGGKVIGGFDYAQMADLGERRDGRTDLGLEGLANLFARVANDCNAPVVLTSQVSRGAVRRGMDVHAAASGNLERAASLVVTAEGPEDKSVITLTCRKNRWGKAGASVNLSADWVGLKFTLAAGVDLSGIIGTPKTPKPDGIRSRILKKLDELYAKKEIPTDYTTLSGLLDVSERLLREHVPALAAIGALRLEAGGGRRHKAKIYRHSETMQTVKP